jgi:hypothetical protein
MKANDYALIHLADDEWGNQTMECIAREFFDEHPDCNFIEVYEHAGWHLCWRRDGSIWGTANDMAKLDGGPRPTGYLSHVVRRDLGTEYEIINGRVVHHGKAVAA